MDHQSEMEWSRDLSVKREVKPKVGMPWSLAPLLPFDAALDCTELSILPSSRGRQ